MVREKEFVIGVNVVFEGAVKVRTTTAYQAKRIVRTLLKSRVKDLQFEDVDTIVDYKFVKEPKAIPTSEQDVDAFNRKEN